MPIIKLILALLASKVASFNDILAEEVGLTHCTRFSTAKGEDQPVWVEGIDSIYQILWEEELASVSQMAVCVLSLHRARAVICHMHLDVDVSNPPCMSPR